MSQQNNSTIQFVVPTSTEMDLTINEFLIAKRQIGRTRQTIGKYREILATFSDWLAREAIDRPDAITRQLARRWGAAMYDHELKPATIRQRTACVRSFLGWCWEERIIAEDLRQSLKLPPVKAGPQRTLDYDEIQKLLAACDETPKGIRDRAIINLLLDTGLRASEMCAVKVKDVTFGVKFITPEGEVVVNKVEAVCKGSAPGVGYFAEEAEKAVRDWLAVREIVNLTRLPELFFALGGNTPFEPLTRDGLRAMLRKLGESVGVAGVTTHAFRRSMACFCEEAGASSREVMEYGRWSSLEIVRRYTQAYQAGRKFALYSPANYINKHRKQG